MSDVGELREASVDPTSNGQAKRSEATRSKLIEAMIDCLFRQGYGGATTIAVAQKARVSRGAMLHHFPTRVDLIIAVAEHIVRDQDARRRAMLVQVPRGRQRFAAITDVVWETMQEPASMALIEIMLGSRSDPDLSLRFPAVLGDLEAKLVAGPLEVARDMGVRDLKTVEAMTRLHLAAMRGLMIEKLFHPPPEAVEDAVDLLRWYKELLTDRLEGKTVRSAKRKRASSSIDSQA
jgi:AcrR family transcriptional regulator